MTRKIATLLLIPSFLLFLLSASCRKSNQAVPYVPVDLYINVSLPLYSNLNVVGGWVYINGGSKGLIVYRQTTETFMAYDRHCTYNIDNPCGAASVDSTNLTISCDCDGSQYQIYDGAVINGPATYSLHQYRTSYNPANNTLHIYN